MNEIKYDAVADIALYTTEKGGRKGPTPKNFFACPLQYQGKNFDCRFLLSETGPVFPGEEKKRVPILFLNPSEALIYFTKGTEFKLWEAGIIGEGRIVEINNSAIDGPKPE